MFCRASTARSSFDAWLPGDIRLHTHTETSRFRSRRGYDVVTIRVAAESLAKFFSESVHGSLVVVMSRDHRHPIICRIYIQLCQIKLRVKCRTNVSSGQEYFPDVVAAGFRQGNVLPPVAALGNGTAVAQTVLRA